MTNSPFTYTAALTGTLATNILQPAAAGSGTGYTPTASYIILRHMRVVNTTGGALAVSLFVGASASAAAGTEFAWSATSVPANSYLDWFGYRKLLTANFLTGGSTTTGLTLNIEGEIGVIP